MENLIKSNLIKVCDVLNKYEVEYILIGGTAVGFYGYIRASHPQGFTTSEIKHDLDFWYNPTISNFHRLSGALADLGVKKKSLDNIVFDPKKTFLRIPQSTFKMEFLCQVIGLDHFGKAKSNVKYINMGSTKIPLIGYYDLIKSKSVKSREIDINDIRELQKRNKGKGLSK